MALVLEWDFEQYQEDDLLIALHTRFVPCKLAYWLNKVLGIRLERSLEDLYDQETATLFPLFSYEDELSQWHLITNKVREKVAMGLFDQVEQQQLFIKELPKVDYLLRTNTKEETLYCLSLLKEQSWIDFIYEIPLFPEEKVSNKEQKKLKEIKSKLIF